MLWATFTLDEDSVYYYENVVRKFDEHFVPRRNTIHERACFHRRSQLQGENVEAFVRHLYELAERCDFGVTKEEQIRDRIVIGIVDSDVSQKLQLEADLTLEKAICIARQSELIQIQNAGARSAEGDVSAVICKFKQFKPFEKRQAKGSQHFKGTSKTTHGKSCTRCGRMRSLELVLQQENAAVSAIRLATLK